MYPNETFLEGCDNVIKKLFSFFVFTIMLASFLVSPPAYRADPIPSIQNPGFETSDNTGGAANWYAPGGWNGSLVTWDKTVYHNGAHSAKLTKTTDARPYIQQTISVTPHTVYEIRLWVRHDTYSLYEDSRNLRLRYQFYSDVSASSASYLKYDETYSEGFTPPTDVWKQKTLRVTSPENARMLRLGVYLTENGAAWIDDIEIAQVEAPLRFTLETDCVFYYPDQKTGLATAGLTADYADTLQDGSVTFTLLDGKKELARKNNVPISENKAFFLLDLSLLTYKKKAYTVQAILYAADGQALEVRRTEVYKYDRPTLFDENGYMTVNGARFIPTIGYHSYYLLDEAKAHGVNVIQTGNGFVQEYLTNKDQFVSLLDTIYEKGMRAFVSLYGYMRFPSDNVNRDAVTKMITDLKDHPAIYCWGIMDEPFDSFSDPREGMRESYKLIRNIDDKHPVMVMVNDSRFYEEGIKYCDVFAHDPYPPSPYTGAEPANHVQTVTATAVRTARVVKKPVLSVNQAYVYHGYTPGIADERNMWYQALLGGSQGCGYYAIDEMLDIPELQSGIFEFAKEEQAFSYRLFSSEAAAFNQETNKEFSFKISILDEKPYLLILNRSNDSKTITIPLTSRNGKVSLASGKLSPLYGTSDFHEPASDAVSIPLSPRQAAVYRIDGVEINLSDLQLPTFTDLSAYPADVNSIESLYSANIIEAASGGKFSPDMAITRGAFADLLVKTLGLSVVKELRPQNYVDIPTDAAYADSVHIARYYGLFREITGNNFYPNAAITRAEAFSVFSRGLEIATHFCGQENDAALLSLWDAQNIPSYAKLHFARLLGAGLIQADANHAIRPSQNLTRIEAANLAAHILHIAPSASEITEAFVSKTDLQMLSGSERKLLESFFGETAAVRKDSVLQKKSNIDGKWYGIIGNLTSEKQHVSLYVPSDRIYVLCGLARGEISCKDRSLSLSVDAGRTVLYEIPDADEGIPNGDFELASGNLPYGWTMHAENDISTEMLHLVNDSASVKSGRFSLQMGNNTMVSEQVYLSTVGTAFSPDTLYTFSAWMKPQTPASGKINAEAYLEWLDAEGQNIVGYEASLLDTEKAAADWKYVSTLTKAPSAAKKFRITLRYTGIGAESGIYFWDAFSLQPAENYVQNGDFSVSGEDNIMPAGWNGYGGMLESGTDPLDGNYLTLSGEGCYVETTVTCAGLSGQTCKISLYYRTDVAHANGTVSLHGIWNSNAHHIAVNLPPTNGKWQEYNLKFTVSKGQETFRLRLYPEEIGDGAVCFDNIRLMPITNSPDTEIYTNGSLCTVHPTQNLTPIENLGWSVHTLTPGQSVSIRASKGIFLTKTADFYIAIYEKTDKGLRKMQALIPVKNVTEMEYGNTVKDMGYCASFSLPNDLPIGDYTLEPFIWESQSMRPSPYKLKMAFSVTANK